MKLFKKRPPSKKGHAIVIHLSPWELERVVFPASPMNPERVKICHKILGYSYKKQEPFDPTEFETVDSLLTKLRKEIANGKKAK
jgi:hypothetical protein